MKNKTLLVLLVFLSININNAVAQQDSIKFENNKYFLGDQQLNNKDLKALLQKDSEAFQYYRKSMSKSGVATFLGISGCIMIGWTAVIFKEKDKINWGLGGTGVAFTIVSGQFTEASSRFKKRSVEVYNQNKLSNQSAGEINFYFGFSGNGVGAGITF